MTSDAMGSSVSYHSQPDNLGLLYVNKTRTRSKAAQSNPEGSTVAIQNESIATQSTSEGRTVATQTDVLEYQKGTLLENTDLSIRNISLHPEPDNCHTDDDEDLDNISVSSQDSVSSMYTEPTADGLERVQYHMKRLRKRKNFLNPSAVIELSIFTLALPKPKPNSTGKFDKRAERFLKEMVKLGVMDVIGRILREYSADALAVSMPKNPAYMVVLSVLGFSMVASIISLTFCENIRQHALHSEMFKLLDNTCLRPESNDNYRNFSGRFKLRFDFVMQMLSILLFCIKKTDMRNQYRKCDAVRIFDLYRKTDNALIRPLAQLGFAFVVMETDKDLMLIKNETLDFFKRFLEQTMKRKAEMGDSKFAQVHKIDNILKALNCLAVNDTNKVAIAKHDVLNFYVMHLDSKTCSENELIEATKGLYLMAFRAHETLKNAPGCVESKYMSYRYRSFRVFANKHRFASVM